MEGGYVLINLADIKLFERLLITLDLGKPILLRDGKQNYFIDKITGGNVTAYEDDGITPSTYADIVLTSAIGTITIKQNGAITKASNPDTSELNEYNEDDENLELSAPNEIYIGDIVISNDDEIQGAKLNDCQLTNDLDCNNNELGDVCTIVFHDETSMSTAPKLYYNVILDNSSDLHINTIISSNIELQSLTYNDLLTFLEDNAYTSLSNLIANGVKSTNNVIGLFYDDDMGSNKIFAKTGYGSSALISSTGLNITIKEL